MHKRSAVKKAPTLDLSKDTTSGQHLNQAKFNHSSNVVSLLSPGRTVAVKQLTLAKQSGVGDREFLLEVALLSRLHHMNLVQLVGYCGDAEERLLVYEFMQAGTLREHLNGKSALGVHTGWRPMQSIKSAAAPSYLGQPGGC
jgi:serine/threonine protein kinase